MVMFATKHACLVMALAFLTATGPAPDQPSEERLSDGTARLRIAAASGTPGVESVDDLAAVAERADDAELRALAAFNAGTMALGAGDERAADLLTLAEGTTGEPGLRARARFNLAHAALPEADAPEDTMEAIDAKVKEYREAARRFRSVLEVDPAHAEAARNTELVRRRIRDLLDRRAEIERQEQAAQELADQLDELAEQQEEQAERSEQQAQDGGSPRPGSAEDQEALSEQTQEASESADQAGAGDDARAALERAQAAQEKAQEALEAGDASRAAEHQREAAEALREAAERARPDQGEGEGEETRPGSDGEPGEPGEQAPEDGEQPGESASNEADAGPSIDPLAEALLDKERNEREQRNRYLQRGRRVPVERDW